MDLWTALRVIGRHWLVLVVGLVLAGVVVAAIGVRLEQRYSATGTVVVIAPGGSTNPIDIYSSSTPLGASVAAALGGAPTSKDEVRAEGGTSDYTLVTDPNLPVITITTTATDPGTAVRSFRLVSRLMNQLLAQRQRALSSPPSTMLQVLDVTAPTTATVTTFKVAIMAVAGGLGAVLVIAAALIAEGAGVRRRARRKEATAIAPKTTAPTRPVQRAGPGVPAPRAPAARPAIHPTAIGEPATSDHAEPRPAIFELPEQSPTVESTERSPSSKHVPPLEAGPSELPGPERPPEQPLSQPPSLHAARRVATAIVPRRQPPKK